MPTRLNVYGEKITNFNTRGVISLFKKTFYSSVVKEFSNTYLSGNLRLNGVRYTDYEILIQPQNYDTAWYILSGRKLGYNQINFTMGSYASDLNKKGSEFELFKKKQPTRIPQRALPLSQLKRVKVYPHNHKGFIKKGIIDACRQIQLKYGGRIVKWQIRD